MPESKLKPMDLRMLRTPGVREEFNAPELERLLGGEGVDLSMTDQPEACLLYTSPSPRDRG